MKTTHLSNSIAAVVRLVCVFRSLGISIFAVMLRPDTRT